LPRRETNKLPFGPTVVSPTSAGLRDFWEGLHAARTFLRLETYRDAPIRRATPLD
jgi:hypothetical protein